MDSYEKFAQDSFLNNLIIQRHLDLIVEEDRLPLSVEMAKVLHANFEEEYEYADNFRFAVNNDLDKYIQIQNQGCCGTAEFRFNINKNVYHFGFNYGH